MPRRPSSRRVAFRHSASKTYFHGTRLDDALSIEVGDHWQDVFSGKQWWASNITFTGPHDSIKAGLETSGKDAVYFRAEIPNPDFDPEEYYVIRGVKKWWEKPTKSVAYLTIDLDQKGESYRAGTAWTDDKHRRQGLIRRLYDMAWDYARSKGKGFRSGWVQSPHMARYWESMVSKGKAEPYTDEWTRSNVTDKGWRRIKSASTYPVTSVATAIFNESGQVLILRRGSTAPWMPGKWSLPGGVVDPGEGLRQAAIREAIEETTLRVRSASSLAVLDHAPEGWAAAFFVSGPGEWSGEVKLDYENDAYAWISASEIGGYSFIPTVKEALMKAFRSSSASRVASRHVEAGLLKAPPVLLKSIQEWVASALCTHLKAKYPTDEVVKKLPCSDGGNPRSMKYQTIFDLTADDFRGWPYLRVVGRERQKALARAEAVLGHDVDQIGGVSRNAPLEDWALHFAKGGLHSEGRLDRIKVVVDFNPTKRGGGWFTRNRQYAILYVSASDADPRGQYDDGPPTEGQIRVWGRIMDGVVEHELLHYTQSVIDAITRQDSAAGLPPQKIRTPDLIQPDFDSLRSDSYGAFQEYVRQHALDDREFYTRLRDEVRGFNQYARKYQTHKDIEGIREEWERSRKVWVATPNHRRLMKLQRYGSPEARPFFRALIDGAPGKWRKAVGEFMAATEASAPVPQTAKPRLPSGRKTHNYTGTDPKIRRMLEDPQPFLERDVEAYEKGVSAIQEGLRERRERLVERSRKRVEAGKEPYDIEAKMERIAPDPEEYAEAPQLWVQGDYSDVYPGSSTFFPVIRDYAPDLYSQMAAEFKRRVEQPRSSRVASRYRAAKETVEVKADLARLWSVVHLGKVRVASFDELAYYGLDGMLEGKPTTLYHGTTAWFRKFDLSKSRDELVNQFYGSGIFLTPKKSVAGQYANANRNIGFPPEIIKDFKRADPKGGAFMEALYKQGDSAWDTFDWQSDPALEDRAQDIADLTDWIIGTKTERPTGEGFTSIFSMSSGMPEYIYDRLDDLGLNSLKYRPKVYTVTANVKNPLVTASKSEARKAKSKGYDSVIYTGSDLVDEVPEVAVFDPRKVAILKVEEW